MSELESPRIRVATSDPKLKSKIQVDLDGNIDIVYWSIRFNIPLDEETVNEKTMEVTDTEGYIMRTDISYRIKSNTIVISPLDSYEDQRYYLLKISRKVRSGKGQNLKTVISILFKLYQGAISEYKVLKKDVPVPKSKERPVNYDDMQKSRKKNYLDNYVENRTTHTSMKSEPLGIKIWPGILGLLVVGVGLASDQIIILIIGVIGCIGSLVYLIIQGQNRVFRSKIHYNRGVRFYNRMQYEKATECFQRSININEANELAKYGLVRVNMYKTDK